VSERADPPVNLIEFEAAARRVLSRTAYDYAAGGSAQEVTLRRNREAFDALRLRPRALVDVGRVDTGCEVLGARLPFPILLAPTAFHRLFHPEGEVAVARAAGETGTTLVVSSIATTPIEAIAAAAGAPLWFQLYVQRDRGFTRELIARVEAVGCRALVLTADTPVLGSRDRERRASFVMPPELVPENLRALMDRNPDADPHDRRRIHTEFIDPTVTWRDVEWLRSVARVPLLLKGLITPEDAARAVEHGAQGVIVSNHGGRNLDTLPATIEALPGVVAAVAGRVPVLMDGGVRRGTDVVKALALGARAVLIGRPYLWGLALDGADGVRRVIEMLHLELEETMALLGRPDLASLDHTALWT
jgi:4-hydroxymandelate oxidase